jgi:hypothetical protein
MVGFCLLVFLTWDLGWLNQARSRLDVTSRWAVQGFHMSMTILTPVAVKLFQSE